MNFPSTAGDVETVSRTAPDPEIRTRPAALTAESNGHIVADLRPGVRGPA
ncbi:hypothetical protein ACIHCV_01925 [Streptomyces sp. NPDC051956]